jgi:hypothetical protein
LPSLSPSNHKEREDATRWSTVFDEFLTGDEFIRNLGAPDLDTVMKVRESDCTVELQSTKVPSTSLKKTQFQELPPWNKLNRRAKNYGRTSGKMMKGIGNSRDAEEEEYERKVKKDT